MFLHLQLPFTDLRPFLSRPSGRLQRPPFPFAEDTDFVRSVGRVTRRPRGGVQHWSGEEWVCRADSVLRLPPSLGALTFDTHPAAGHLRCTFRRYLSAGGGPARYEMGLCHERPPGSRPRMGAPARDSFIERLMGVPVRVEGRGGEAPLPLIDAPRHVARFLLEVTTANAFARDGLEDWWFSPGRPTIVVEHAASETVNSGLRRVEAVPGSPTEIRTGTVWAGGSRTPIWWLSYPDGEERRTRAQRRELRLHLLRLNAEWGSIHQVLRLLAMQRLEVRAQDAAGRRLLSFLEATTKKLNKHRRFGMLQDPVLRAAYAGHESLDPGRVETIMEGLDQARRHVQDGVRAFVQQYINVEGDYVAGDSYEVSGGQVGAFGAGARAHDFTQIWQAAPLGDEDLPQLARELAQLRAALEQEAAGRGDDSSVQALSSAEQAAADGDGASVMRHLRRAGQWVLSVADRVGVVLAGAALKAALGL